MSCEGYEYNLLYEDNCTLQKFKQMEIEYFYGYEKLKDKLEECGFIVKHSEPMKNYNKESYNPHRMIGYIYAELNK